MVANKQSHLKFQFDKYIEDTWLHLNYLLYLASTEEAVSMFLS